MIASTKNGATDWLKVTTYFILLTGASLRLIQYLGRSSYWKDELFSVVNIEKMSMVELLTQQPEYNQVAGPGFYIIQKSMVSLFGDSIELVPRLYPLSASILSLWVFYLIARKFLSGFKLLASLVLISFSIASLGQSFQARPYSGDIFFIMFFVHSIISLKENRLRAWQYWATGIVGMIGATASLPTAIFVLGAIALLVWQRIKDATIEEALPCLTLWGLGALANILYVKLVISQDVRDALLEHWSHGFPSRDSIFDFLKFYPISIWRSITGFLAFGPLGGSLGTVMMALSVPGMIYLFQKDKFRLLVLISPLLMALALTTFYIYPYFHRTTYYASWPFLIFPFLGLMYLQQAVKWWKPMIANSIAVLIIILPVLVIANFIPHLPYEIEPIKKPLQIIQANRKPGDKVYVHHKGDLYMEYYGPKIGVNDYVLGSDESLLSEEAYAHELKQFSGEPRVWYFYVGARPETNPEVNAAEIREMLDHKAEKIEEFDYPKGLYETFLILYDFTKK